MALGNFSLNQRECILFSVVLLGVTGLYMRYWERPQAVRIQNLRAEITATEAEINANTEAIGQLPSRPPVSIESKASQDLIAKYRDSNRRFADVITNIATENPKFPFQLSRISTESQAFSDGFSQVLYDIELEATFFSIGKFLERLEDSALLTEVHSIEIARIDGEMKRCHTKIKLFSYSIPEEK